MCDSTFYFKEVIMKTIDEQFMLEAISQAHKAEEIDEVPIGCVIVKDGQIIAKGHNLREKHQSSLAHAEIIAIEQACKQLGTWRLKGCELYVTLEPCPMCSGAILQSRIARVIYGAKDVKGGCIESSMHMYEVSGFNHYPTVTSGILADECSQLLSDFFRKKRMIKKQKTDMNSCQKT